MRVAILSSEVVPFAKTGGLADVAGALPKALCESDVDAIVVLPLYQQIDRELLEDEVIGEVPVQWRGGTRLTKVFKSNAAGAPAYLIDAPEYFSRSSIYGFGDDHARFAFFSRAALALFKYLDWQPNIIHTNDWPCGFAAIELRARRLKPRTDTTGSFHNVAALGSLLGMGAVIAISLLADEFGFHRTPSVILDWVAVWSIAALMSTSGTRLLRRPKARLSYTLMC